MNDDVNNALRLRDVVAMNTLPTGELAEQREVVDRVQARLANVRWVEELDELDADLAHAKALNASVEGQMRPGGGTS